MKKIKTVFVVGPTASGKTGLAVELAKRFDGEVISADSMQIYKGIHIASAAPNTEEMQGIKHHLIEFLSTDEQYSVADYVKTAKEKIEDISARGKLPIVAGGTGLYISALLDNTDFLKEETDFDLRKKLEEEFDREGAEAMLGKLKEIDLETALRLHKNDRRRIVRAFEVYYLTGKTISEQNRLSHLSESFIEPLVLGITYREREKLYERINLRVDKMLENGLLAEAEATLLNGNGTGAFQAIGHKELYGYFKGEIPLAEATENLKQQTRRYAKRQLTWFRKDGRINWIFADSVPSVTAEAVKLTEEFLRRED